jgi:hypothetical protein
MDYEQRLADLNKRASVLTKTRDAKLKEAAQQEQTRENALDELDALGYPQARTMKVKELESLRDQIEAELDGQLEALEETLKQGEALLEEEEE